MSEMVINNETVNTVETEKKANAWEIIKTVRYFLPVLSSIGAAMWAFIPSGSPFYSFGVMLMLVGYIAAMTVCPLKLLAFPFKCIPAGFKIFRGFIPFYGVADLVAALFGTVTGFVVGLFITLMAPAYFTIKKYIENK